ncbi:MAG: YDG domain-containing protein, partial [Gammaproteobacteria bacterium]
GTGLTLTPLAVITDGNSGNNYSISYVNNLTGVITARALTVTAATNTKIYDANTSALATPTITSGALQGSDSAVLSETYANKNVGTGLTLTPLAVITDGNSGNNYSISYANNLTGVITARPLTITAATNTKIYDANTSALATPTITSGALQGSDSAVLSETYADKNVGTGLTLTPLAFITDGNSGNNYQISYVNNLTGIITARPLTVTAITNTKSYNTTVSAAAIPIISSGALQGSDSAVLSETYGTINVGTNLTLTPVASISDGNSGNNYSVSYVANNTGIITAAPLTVSGLIASNKVYDTTTAATLNASSATLSGVFAADTGNVNLTGTAYGIFSSANAGNDISVITTSVPLSGSASSNYTVLQPADLTANISPATLNLLSAYANNKSYTSTTYARLNLINAVLNGVLPSDVGNVVINNSGYSANFVSANAALGIPVNATNLLAGSAAGNYIVSNPSFSGNITPAGLVISANPASKKFGASNPVLTYAVGGLINNSSSQALAGELSRQPGDAVGQYAITLGTLNSYNTNYMITTFNSNTFTILPAANTSVSARVVNISANILAGFTPITTPGTSNSSVPGALPGIPKNIQIETAFTKITLSNAMQDVLKSVINTSIDIHIGTQDLHNQ